MAENDDSDPIGPDDGTIEMDREAMMRRVKEGRITDKIPSIQSDDAATEETKSIAVPTELLKMTRDDASMPPKTLDILLEEIDEYDTGPISETATRPLGPVRYLEFVAMVDERGAIQLPGPCLQTPGFKPGSAIKVRIETVDDD